MFRVIVPLLILAGVIALRIAWGHDIRPFEPLWIGWVLSLSMAGGNVGYAICYVRMKRESERKKL